jgi:hypothetical protein
VNTGLMSGSSRTCRTWLACCHSMQPAEVSLQHQRAPLLMCKQLALTKGADMLIWSARSLVLGAM